MVWHKNVIGLELGKPTPGINFIPGETGTKIVHPRGSPGTNCMLMCFACCVG